MTEAQSILKLWREHFLGLLNGSESVKFVDGEPDSPIDDDRADVLLPYRIAISRLNNNEAVGTFPAEIFKYDDEKLIRSIQQLLCSMWSDESMPDNRIMLCPIHKKRDPTYAPTKYLLSLNRK